MAVIQTQKPAEAGPKVWPLSVKDRSKLRAYASAKVKECWLVMGPEKVVEAYREPKGEQFAERSTQGRCGTLTSAAAPAFTVDLERLFAM